ncbi:MAG: hypothetical protein AAFQ98_21470, partial [Bacteroidota bacterium]
AFLKHGAAANAKVSTKHHASDTDGIRVEAHYPDKIPQANHAEVFGSFADQILTVDTLKLGVEVCRDHINKHQVLKSSLMEYRGIMLQQDETLDFHLLTCCDIAVVRGSIASQENGYFFRVDGKVADDNRITLKQCLRQGYAKDRLYYMKHNVYWNNWDSVRQANAWYQSLPTKNRPDAKGGTIGVWQTYLKTEHKDKDIYANYCDPGQSPGYQAYLDSREDNTKLGLAERLTATALPDTMQRTNVANNKDRLMISGLLPIGQKSNRNIP